MNNDTCNNATDRPVSLNNEATSDATVFPSSAPAPTVSAVTFSGAASTIVPDAHIPPSGQKQHTEPFSPVNMKKMAKKEKIDTTPDLFQPKMSPTLSFSGMY